MYKTEYLNEEWNVVQINKSKNKMICSIPKYYRQDKSIAEGIAYILNNNRKIILDLSI